MTQEEKSLLLKDLCARLPYGVKVSILGGGAMELQACINSSIGWYFDIKDAPTDFALNEIKPYLRPMSSMTEEEKEEYCNLQDKFLCSSQYPVTDAYELFDWLNAHHFDYRGLIEKGLAIEAKEGTYN